MTEETGVNPAAEFWDARYRERSGVWSVEPNPTLTVEVRNLRPGRALDVGSGEGVDACWLAACGWQVTGIEISSVAIERAKETTEAWGVEVEWLQHDLIGQPAPASYHLVTAHFLHLPQQDRQALWRHLIEAVAPGGTLLIVGHDRRDLDTSLRRPPLNEVGWDASEVVEALDQGWAVDTAESRPRKTRDPLGDIVVIHDVVVRAHRREELGSK